MSGLLPLTVALAVLCGTHTRAQADPPPTAAAAAPTTLAPQDEVTVEAQRIPLTRRVENFVTQIAPRENGGEAGLPVWKNPPLCPLVSGLLPQENDSILARLSDMARAAGAPMAGEPCHANLYVLVTPQPQALLRAMEKRNYLFTFGLDTTPSTVDAFIAEPRSVRVWYNTGMLDSQGHRMARGREAQVEITSKLDYGVTWAMLRVFVVIDLQRLQGVSRQQLADYVAMVALAHIRPDAHLSDAPTILRLFDGAPQSALAGLSEWDRAFLKSLYSTNPRSKLQQGQITRTMVHEIAP